MTTTEHLMTILVVMASYITCTLIIINQLLRNKLDQERKDSIIKIEALVKKDRRIAKLEDYILKIKGEERAVDKIHELEQKNIEIAIDYNNRLIEQITIQIELRNQLSEIESKIQQLPTSGENLTLLETKVNELKKEINAKDE